MSCLLHHSETVCVVTVENVGSHEGEDRHNVVQYRIRCQTC